MWTDVSREAADHLSHVLALGTSIPPAWELPAARYLLEVFEREGIPAFLLPGRSGGGTDLSGARPNLVAHVPGTGAEEPLLLLSHLDSAPRLIHDWDISTLGIGRRLIGPGALLGTHLAVAQAMALILLARSGMPLRRTVRFAGTSEGTGGKGAGLRTLAENHLEHISSEIALGWGALSWIGRDGTPCSMLACAEKGAVILRIRSEGGGGRIGVTVGRDPVERLVRALGLLEKLEFPARPSDASSALVDSIASTVADSGIRELLEGLNAPSTAPKALAALEAEQSVDPGLRALLKAALKTEWGISRLDASAADGLRPVVAEAEIQCCYPPGEDAEEVARKVMEPLRSDGVYLAEKQVVEPSGSEATAEILGPVRAALNDVDPEARLIVGMSPWPTGLAAMRRYGTSVYGWEPFVSAGSLADTLGYRGGPGESLAAEDFAKEVQAYYSFLVRATR